MFWKSERNFFPDKSNNFEAITVVKNNMVISNNQKIADILMEYFDNIVPKLGLAILKNVIFATNGIDDPFSKQHINIRDILVYLDSKKIRKT